MKRSSLLVLVSIFVGHLAGAQPTPFSPTALLSQGSIYQWTGQNGLISNNITSAIQSSEGFIWITTYNGIMRFDGNRIVVYDRLILPFLETDAFYQVYEDYQGTLWFASQGSGIVLYRNKQFELLKTTGEKVPKSIRSLLIEESGIVWIGSNNEGLYKLNQNLVLEKVVADPINNVGILDIVKDGNGKLWIATDGNGLFSYDGTTFNRFDQSTGLLSDNVNALALSKEGAVYVGSADGLNVIKDGKISAFNFLLNIPVNDLSIDVSGRKWIATENGLARISADDQFEEFANRKNGFPYTRLNSISRDAEGSLWISTGRDGLLQMRETGIVNIGEEQGLSSGKINIIVEEADQTFYIGSDVGSVDRYKQGLVERISFKTDLKQSGIRDICQGDNGTIWIASYRGILRLQGTSEKLLTEKEGLPAVDMRRVLKDKNGDLWFASRSQGLVKFSAKLNKVLRVYNKENGLGSNYILSVEQDSKGQLYVGTHSGGMTIIRPDGSFTTYQITKDDSGVLIFNIHIAAEDKIWIVSNIGPYLFDGASFRRIKLKAINKGETYFDWVEDDRRNIWVTTNLGVLRIKRASLDQFLSGKDSVVHTKLFDNQDGMRTKECTGATRSLLSSTGKIWVPTIGGVAVFYPDKILENPISPKVYVTDLVSDHDTFDSDSVIIEPGNLRYIFNYTALSYLAPSKIRFKYKLDPVDPDWVEAQGKRQAEYTNLAPGTYTFRAVASNSDGVWNTEGATKILVVKPFFYQTTWFYVVSLLLVVTLLYGIYQWRVYVVEKRNRELRKLNSELDRFVYSASHDLRAPLSSILGLIAVARLDKSKNVDEYLTLIEKSIHKLDGFIHDIIDFSRNSRLELTKEVVPFEEMIYEIIDELKYMDDRNTIQKIVEVNGKGNFYSDRKRLAIILRNLISNSIKYHNPYGTENFLKVSVNFDEREAMIKVIDNGIGIPAEHLPNIFKMFYRASETNKGSGLGLYIVKETVDKLKGSITAKSTPGKETIFELKLPGL